MIAPTAATLRRVAVLSVCGCGAADEGAPRGVDGRTIACARDEAAQVLLHTRDELRLEADFHPSGVVGGPGVVLLHMRPPGYDRGDWPSEFVTGLVDAGYAVVNVDRRGAGRSEGDHEDAFEGDTGWLDPLAAHELLTASQCEAPAGRIALVGASNGTTSALDFTAHTLEEDPMRVPATLVFLSAGSYTENQSALEIAAEVPISFVYPMSESEWNEAAIVRRGTAPWGFFAIEGDAHGTDLLGDEGVRSLVLAQLRAMLPP